MPDPVTPGGTAPGLSAAPAGTVDDLVDAYAAEWGVYVALGPIDIHGGRAANRGDKIPVSHVKDGLVSEDQVAKTTTKAGRAAAGLADESKG